MRCAHRWATTLVDRDSGVASWAPEFVGIALGFGGLGGGYIGARLQPRLPELVVRRLLGVVVLAIGIRYIWLALASLEAVAFPRPGETSCCLHRRPGGRRLSVDLQGT